jgi:predicted nucleic acid-binding protein
VIVTDTTILLYAVGAEHEYAEPSRRFFDAVVAGRLSATTTVEAIQEFAHVYARRRSRTEARRHAQRFAELLSPLLASDTADLSVALRLFERHSELGGFDALLAATALSHEAEALLSADTGFAAVPRLRHVAPGTPAFERLVAA